MLQQGELEVVRCEKESARGVHLDSKVGRVNFLARRPIGSCNLVLLVHHRLMRSENLYKILELGRSPLCIVKRETSW